MARGATLAAGVIRKVRRNRANPFPGDIAILRQPHFLTGPARQLDECQLQQCAALE